MILLAATVLAFVVALVRGGNIIGLASVRLRSGWLAILAFALQVLVIYFPGQGGAGQWGRQALILAGSQVLLLAVVGLNIRLPGMPLAGLGLALNLLVMAANGGYMPITAQAPRRAGPGHRAHREAAGRPSVRRAASITWATSWQTPLWSRQALTAVVSTPVAPGA